LRELNIDPKFCNSSPRSRKARRDHRILLIFVCVLCASSEAGGEPIKTKLVYS